MLTKEDKDKAIAEVIKKYGQPVFEMSEPKNECAKLVLELNTQYRLERVAAARAEKKANGQKQAANTLNEIAQGIERGKYVDSIPGPMFLQEEDLLGFTEEQRTIVKAKFENWERTNKQLAIQYQTHTQTITALFNTQRFKMLYMKVIDRVLPFDAMQSLRRAMRSDDSKVTLRIAEHYGLIKSEKIDVNMSNKPIEDPKAIEMLKQLGDRLAEEKD